MTPEESAVFWSMARFVLAALCIACVVKFVVGKETR